MKHVDKSPDSTQQAIPAAFERALQAEGWAVFLLAEDGTIQATGAALNAVCRRSPAELLGHDFYETLVHPEWREHVREGHQRLRQRQTPQNQSAYALHNPQGQTFQVREEASLSPSPGAEGQLLVCLKPRQPLAHPERLLPELIQHSGDFIGVADAAGQVCYVNPAGLAMVGLDDLNALNDGQSQMDRFIAPEDRARFQREILPQVRARGSWTGELRYRHFAAGGSGIPVQAEIFALFAPDAPDEPIAYATVSRDLRVVDDALALERNLLRSVLDNVPDHIFVLNTHSEYILANRAYAQFMGFDQVDDLLGKSKADFMPPEEAQKYLEEDRQVLRTGEPLLNLQLETQSDNDQPLWFSFSKTPLYGPDGALVGLVGVARDVSAIKRTEAEVRRREELYRTLARNLPKAAVLLYDRELRYLLAEGPLLGQLALIPHEMEGGHLRDFVQPEHYEPIRDAYQSALDGQETAVELLLGTTFFSLRAVPITNAAGDIVGGMAVVQDITERKQAEDALKRSESRHRALLGTLPDMLFALHRDGHYTQFHASQQALPHLDVANAVGKPINAIGLPEDVARLFQRYLTLTLTTRNIQTFEYELNDNHANNNNNGRLRSFYEARMVVLNDEEVLTLVRDITDLKLVQEELSGHIRDLTVLRQVEEELADQLNEAYVVQLAMDAALRLSHADGGFLLTRDPEGVLKVAYVIGHYATGAIERVLMRPDSLVNRVARDQNPVLRLRLTPDTDGLPLLPGSQALMLIPLLSQERLIGLLCLEASQAQHFSQDTYQFLQLVTRRVAALLDNARLYRQTKEQLQELQRLYEEVSKLEQLKTDMIRMASHDLRNPLGAILGYVEMVQWEAREKLSDKSQRYIVQIEQSASQMQKITSSILSLERIGQMAQDGPGEVFDFSELVRQSCGEYQTQAALKQQTLHISVPDYALPIQGDPFQLHEAIANLISNALKYTPNGGEIHARLGLEATWAVFEVRDNGYGVPEDQQDKLFQPFFRAYSEETADIEGTGLGLHLVKNIIERHNGQMRFESNPGQGSLFGFALPLAAT